MTSLLPIVIAAHKPKFQDVSSHEGVHVLDPWEAFSECRMILSLHQSISASTGATELVTAKLNCPETIPRCVPP